MPRASQGTMYFFDGTNPDGSEDTEAGTVELLSTGVLEIDGLAGLGTDVLLIPADSVSTFRAMLDKTVTHATSTPGLGDSNPYRDNPAGEAETDVVEWQENAARVLITQGSLANNLALKLDTARGLQLALSVLGVIA